MIKCRDCGCEFRSFAGKPGYINQCEDCAVDVPLYRAEQGTEDSGVVETMIRGERVSISDQLDEVA